MEKADNLSCTYLPKRIPISVVWWELATWYIAVVFTGNDEVPYSTLRSCAGLPVYQ